MHPAANVEIHFLSPENLGAEGVFAWPRWRRDGNGVFQAVPDASRGVLNFGAEIREGVVRRNFK